MVKTIRYSAWKGVTVLWPGKVDSAYIGHLHTSNTCNIYAHQYVPSNTIIYAYTFWWQAIRNARCDLREKFKVLRVCTKGSN